MCFSYPRHGERHSGCKAQHISEQVLVATAKSSPVDVCSTAHCWRLVTHLHLTNLSGLGWIMVSPPLQHQGLAHHCTQFLCGCLGHQVSFTSH